MAEPSGDRRDGAPGAPFLVNYNIIN